MQPNNNDVGIVLLHTINSVKPTTIRVGSGTSGGIDLDKLISQKIT